MTNVKFHYITIENNSYYRTTMIKVSNILLAKLLVCSVGDTWSKSLRRTMVHHQHVYYVLKIK